MLENKKIFILGMARSGYECAKMLSKHNNEIKRSSNCLASLTNCDKLCIIGPLRGDCHDFKRECIHKNKTRRGELHRTRDRCKI